jgi:hypothetical protein
MSKNNQSQLLNLKKYRDKVLAMELWFHLCKNNHIQLGFGSK